jgi:hypothetical protein
MQPVVNGHTAQPLSIFSSFWTISWNCPFVWQANLCSRSAAMGGHHSKATQGKQTELNLIKALYIQQLIVFVNMYHVMYIALINYSRSLVSDIPTGDGKTASLFLQCTFILFTVITLVRSVYLNFLYKTTSFLGNLLCFITNQYLFVLFYIFHHWRYRFSIKFKPLY